MPDPRDTATTPARPGGAAPRRRSLLIMAADQVEARPLPVVGQLTVGRARGCDITIDHPSISRNHLVLRLDESTIELIDQGGSNGTTLRGVRLPAGVAVRIGANEAFGAGDLTLVVQDVHARAGGEPAAPRTSGQLAPSASAPVVIDPQMKRLYELATRVARGTISVLVVGETGTGKEVLAELLHASSPRATRPLVRINCAAFADALVESELFGHEKGAFTGAVRDRSGLLETADGGTVVLDEVGEMAPAIQAKLLRVLEERAVLRVGASAPRPLDVRFVASTNRDLEAEVDAGRFRRDLYFRLAGVVLAIPPLRERPDDLVALAERFATEAAKRLERPPLRLAPAAVTALRSHGWPGNVRELRNVIDRAVLLADGDVIDAEHLPFGAARTPPPAPARADALPEELASLERQRIIDALAAANGNQTRAAAALGLPLRTLVKRLDQYGLPRPRKR